MTVNVLIFGATGLTMSHLLPQLVADSHLSIAAYVRPASASVDSLKNLGVKTVVGDYGDAVTIRAALGDYDVIWDAANSADPALTEILVSALLDNPNKKTLIRFSGTGNFITQTGGNADATARLYDVSHRFAWNR